jgi:acyl carrier protein
VNIDWNRWRAAHPIVAQSTFFSDQGDATARPADKDTMRSLLAADPGEQLQLVANRLREHLASVVRLPTSRIDSDQPLVTMGIDSLMAVELKNRVERDLGIVMPLLQLIKGPSLSELAQSIVASLSGRTGSSPVAKNTTNRAGAARPSLLTLLAAKDGQASSGGPP